MSETTDTSTAYRRNRALNVAAIIATIALGLASRRFPIRLLAFLGKYPGDALWSLMVFFGWGLLFPAISTARVAALALGTSFTVEFLKLYQAPWIIHLRHTTVGHLIFGQVFSWQNLVAYALGVAMGWAFDAVLLKALARPPTRRP